MLKLAFPTVASFTTALTVCALTLLGCSEAEQVGEPDGGGGGGYCTNNTDCQGGELCWEGLCHQMCFSSDECATGENCIASLCLPEPGGDGGGEVRFPPAVVFLIDTEYEPFAEPDDLYEENYAHFITRAQIGETPEGWRDLGVTSGTISLGLTGEEAILEDLQLNFQDMKFSPESIPPDGLYTGDMSIHSVTVARATLTQVSDQVVTASLTFEGEFEASIGTERENIAPLPGQPIDAFPLEITLTLDLEAGTIDLHGQTADQEITVFEITNFVEVVISELNLTASKAF